MLGKKSVYAKEAFEGGYIGAGWLEDVDLTSIKAALIENRKSVNMGWIDL